MAPKTKVSQKKFDWTPVLIGGIIALILALYVARADYDTPDGNIIEIAKATWKIMSTAPFDIIYLGSTRWVWCWWVFLAYSVYVLFLYTNFEKTRNSYFGKEKGTADWNTWKKYNKKYAYPKGVDGYSQPKRGSNDLGNLILGKDTNLNLNTKETFLNDNVFVIGPTGSGKTRYYVKPNLLQQKTSFIITDPSGELLTDVGMSLMKAGYVVKVFNLFEMQHSCGYNPFEYITSDSDVPILVDCLVKNTADNTKKGGDAFFDQAMVQLFTAIFYYIYYKEPPERRNMGTVCDYLTMMKVDENNPNSKSKLDLMFDKYEAEDPQATAVINYNMFRVGAGKTLKSIIISANVRMRPFTLKAVRDLTCRDTIRLDEIGDHKQAIFIITPTQIKTYNFLAAMMYTQLFTIMFNKGSNTCKNRFMVKWDASSPIQSPVFKNGKERKEIEQAFKERVELYKTAEIKPIKREGLSEEDVEKIGEYKYALELPDGTPCTIGTETGQPAIFECEEQAQYFLECIKNGKIERGNIRLPSHVHLVLDEFANIGVIPDFEQIVATMRKFSISCTLILQSRAQLKNMYQDNADTLIGQCSSILFLGTQSNEDAKWLSERLGKKTQIVRNTSYTYGSKGSTNQAFNKDYIDLMTPDEVMVMPPENCVIQIQGQNPFYDNKYPLEQHPNFSSLADASDENIFPYKVYFVTGEESRKHERNAAVTRGNVAASAPNERTAAQTAYERRSQYGKRDGEDQRPVNGDANLNNLLKKATDKAPVKTFGVVEGPPLDSFITVDVVSYNATASLGITKDNGKIKMAGGMFADKASENGKPVMSVDEDGIPDW